MLAIGQLRLIEGEVDGVLTDERGREVEAEFRVVAEPLEGGEAGVYKLTAMNTHRYEAWYLDVLAEGELAEGEIRPLEVPPAVLAATGLVDHVLREYLDPAEPYRINIIGQCLEGPLDVADQSAQLAA
ncbi:MAG TPA: hypothetical protein VLH86_01320 [Patescibacteria group bacterium]|nr:hypothetical protein [Patescibacteria group bacterium]